MPISYSVSPCGSRVRIVASGHVTPEEFCRNAESIYRDPGIAPTFSDLLDVSQIVHEGLTQALMDDLAKLDHAHADRRRHTRSAMVVRDQEFYSLAQHYVVRRKGVGEVMLFYNLDVAEMWLGFPRSEEH